MPERQRCDATMTPCGLLPWVARSQRLGLASRAGQEGETAEPPQVTAERVAVLAVLVDDDYDSFRHAPRETGQQRLPRVGVGRMESHGEPYRVRLATAHDLAGAAGADRERGRGAPARGSVPSAGAGAPSQLDAPVAERSSMRWRVGWSAPARTSARPQRGTREAPRRS